MSDTEVPKPMSGVFDCVDQVSSHSRRVPAIHARICGGENTICRVQKIKISSGEVRGEPDRTQW